SDRSARYHRERIVLLNISGGASMANDEHVAMLKTARPANARGELIRSRTVRSWRPRIRLCGRFGDRSTIGGACGMYQPSIGLYRSRTGYSLHENARISGLASADLFLHTATSGGAPGFFYARCAMKRASSGAHRRDAGRET